MRKRTRSRELALQMLYQIDARGDDALEQMEEFFDREEPDDEEVHAFARRLVLGTRDKREEIDALLTGAADNWKLHRMAIVDRNILRMAVYEMLHIGEIPAKVSINEAIELGKRFSTKQSGSFINGILDRIRREKRE
jgi:transcription antitermination factor NusB